MFFEGRGQYRMEHVSKESNAQNFMSTLSLSQDQEEMQKSPQASRRETSKWKHDLHYSPRISCDSILLQS